MALDLSQSSSGRGAPGGDDTALLPFDRLPITPRSVAALAAMGIATPTPIQAATIPALLQGRDVVGQSRTGSGKTIAFGLPLVERLDPRLRAVQALIIVPTRELANQVGGVLRDLDGGRGLKVALLVGGLSIRPQQQELAAGAQIAVGAPGRVLDHIRQGSLDLRQVRVVVLDEADQMLDAGFAPDVERILAYTPATRQTVLFSATMPEWTTAIANKYLREPVRVSTAGPGGNTRPAIDQIVYLVPEEQRMDALRALLDRRQDAGGVTLVFGRTKHGVKRLAKRFEALGYDVAALQGNMSQNARDRVMADFRAGKVRVLLATNVAARGLDVLDIEQVINFELPESAELFTHRIGRTARMEREGEAITLLTPSDLPAWRKMQRELQVDLRTRPWPQAEMPLPPPGAGSLALPPETRPRAPYGAGRSQRPAADTAAPRAVPPAMPPRLPGGGRTDRPQPAPQRDADRGVRPAAPASGAGGAAQRSPWRRGR